MDGADPTQFRITVLNELISRLTLLAAGGGYSLTTRLLEGPGGATLELRASRGGADRTQEYSRLVPLGELAAVGAEVIAREFGREARGMLMRPIQSSGPAAQARKAHS
ncbi:MAG TPA: hypothetical protein VMT66_12435 [Steroidobacteraceae bacterium]|nr:hypothetical protein [Steroidobacteraceae bacterium]